MPSRSKEQKSKIRKEIEALNPIKAGHRFFRVCVFSSADWPCNDDHCGCVHFETPEIHIKDSGSPCEMADTLFHECIHTCICLFLQAFRMGKEGADEESYVSAVEVGVTMLFLDNPKLLPFFSKYWSSAGRQPFPVAKKK